MPQMMDSHLSAGRPRRHQPLEHDLTATGPLRTKPAKRKSRHEDDDREANYVGSKQSRKILKIGRELADEDEQETRPVKVNKAFDLASRFEDGVVPLDDGADDDDDDDDEHAHEDWGDEGDGEEEEALDVDLTPADRAMFSKFFPVDEDPLLRDGWSDSRPAHTQTDAGGGGQGTDLAALILERIAQHEAKEARKNGGAATDAPDAPDDVFEMHPKIVEVYSKIGLIMSRYKSGKLPKPFKILPTVAHWEDIIQVTRPEQWTPNACYEATKIFISGKPATAQRFLEMILLERVRDEIQETKKLNIHLFDALKKALYKPAAFFKGFLFPLISSGTCTLREAHIISAALVRVSIPVLHSAAALKGLCDIAAEESSAGTEGGGATNIFIKALLEKKYALPFQVIDALVFHFLRFRSVDATRGRPSQGHDDDGDNTMSDSRQAREALHHKLPLIWHQCLLVFAQRYRNDITEDQREALLDLLLTRGHYAIGPEVRRELLQGRGRGTVLEGSGAAGMTGSAAAGLDGGDDTMMVD